VKSISANGSLTGHHLFITLKLATDFLLLRIFLMITKVGFWQTRLQSSNAAWSGQCFAIFGEVSSKESDFGRASGVRSTAWFNYCYFLAEGNTARPRYSKKLSYRLQR
jgi:hypothetical protein